MLDILSSAIQLSCGGQTMAHSATNQGEGDVFVPYNKHVQYLCECTCSMVLLQSVLYVCSKNLYNICAIFKLLCGTFITCLP